MYLEYLIFNIIVISGPILFGSFRQFYFLDRWRDTVISAGIVAIPYIIWDVLVTDKHWMFNTNYTIDFRLIHLPLGEWLFFLTVPSACIFTWEMILKRSEESPSNLGRIIRYLSFILPAIGVWFYLSGKEYTGLVLFFLSLAVLFDRLFKTNLVYQKRFYLYLGLVIFFTLTFNGYLTWRPVVLYGESYQLGLRIFTIPIEDFGYGISLIFLVTIVYERIKMLAMQRRNKLTLRT